jgi:hypothetical protein
LTPSLGLRGGLRRLATGLIGYGLIGLAVAVLGLVALAWVSGRVAGLAETIDAEVAELAVSLDQSAGALRDASSTAQSFSGTLERTPPAVRQTAQTIASLRPNLLAIESQLASIDIFGNRPLADAAQLFGEMASDLQGLDVRLNVIAGDLDTNRASLLLNARSLDATADGLFVLAERVRTGFIQDGLDDLRIVLILTILVFVGWTAVPAVGALALGLWLRRTLESGGDDPGP